jgi:hypothetical protein
MQQDTLTKRLKGSEKVLGREESGSSLEKRIEHKGKGPESLYQVLLARMLFLWIRILKKKIQYEIAFGNNMVTYPKSIGPIYRSIEILLL